MFHCLQLCLVIKLANVNSYPKKIWMHYIHLYHFLYFRFTLDLSVIFDDLDPDLVEAMRQSLEESQSHSSNIERQRSQEDEELQKAIRLSLMDGNQNQNQVS